MIIVVDDDSPDGTWKIAGELDDPHVAIVDLSLRKVNDSDL